MHPHYERNAILKTSLDSTSVWDIILIPNSLALICSFIKKITHVVWSLHSVNVVKLHVVISAMQVLDKGVKILILQTWFKYTGSSKKMDGIWNRYNLKSTGRIYTFGVLKCSEKFKVLDLP